MSGYPSTLPRTIDELIADLDRVVVTPNIESPPLDEPAIQDLLFAAGRRSIVNELLLLQKRRDQ